jgi:hypothetical protein
MLRRSAVCSFCRNDVKQSPKRALSQGIATWISMCCLNSLQMSDADASARPPASALKQSEIDPIESGRKVASGVTIRIVGRVAALQPLDFPARIADIYCKWIR